MEDDCENIYSPLARSITEKEHTVEVCIYRGSDTDWYLEVINAEGTSTLWEDQFPTDQAALDEVFRVIREDGIESLAIVTDAF